MNLSEKNKGCHHKSYPDVLSSSDIMEILKVGKNTTYFLLKNKKIQSIK